MNSKFLGKIYEGYEVVDAFVNKKYNDRLYGKDKKYYGHRSYNYTLFNSQENNSITVSGNQLRLIDSGERTIYDMLHSSSRRCRNRQITEYKRQFKKNDFMMAAIEEAYKGIEKGHGGPFGCVIVKDGKIVGKGHNEVLKNNDCTCHGEIQAIRNACKKLNTFDLSGCDLYTSAKACPMCQGAIQWARISNVYEACNYEDTESIGFDDKVFFENPILGKELLRSEGQKLFKDYSEKDAKRY